MANESQGALEIDELGQAVVEVIEAKLGELQGPVPGTVIATRGSRLADVRVDVSLDVSGLVLDAVVVPRVEILQPVGAQGGITFPVAVGDRVWLVPAGADISSWRVGSPAHLAPRRFSLADAVAIPGAYPGGSTPWAGTGTVIGAATSLQLGSALAAEPLVLGSTFLASMQTWISNWLGAISQALRDPNSGGVADSGTREYLTSLQSYLQTLQQAMAGWLSAKVKA